MTEGQRARDFAERKDRLRQIMQIEEQEKERKRTEKRKKKKKKKTFIGARPFFMQHCNNPLI